MEVSDLHVGGDKGFSWRPTSNRKFTLALPEDRKDHGGTKKGRVENERWEKEKERQTEER